MPEEMAANPATAPRLPLLVGLKRGLIDVLAPRGFYGHVFERPFLQLDRALEDQRHVIGQEKCFNDLSIIASSAPVWLLGNYHWSAIRRCLPLEQQVATTPRQHAAAADQYMKY